MTALRMIGVVAVVNLACFAVLLGGACFLYSLIAPLQAGPMAWLLGGAWAASMLFIAKETAK